MINQNGTKMFFLQVLRYALAAAAVLLGYFIVMMAVFSLAGTSYGSMAYVLLFPCFLFFSVYVLNRLNG